MLELKAGEVGGGEVMQEGVGGVEGCEDPAEGGERLEVVVPD